VCKISFKDSAALLDHYNGKKHNKMLGMSMVVEKVGVDKVREKLNNLKRKNDTPLETIEDIAKRIEE
jgi:U4/U6.U5 tri-snRNP component SNU23